MPFENNVEKGVNAGHQHFLLFATIFFFSSSIFSKAFVKFRAILDISPANAFNLDRSTILLLGKQLKRKMKNHPDDFESQFIILPNYHIPPLKCT